jgi:alkanesulfonate monooxygenase SsuD/methylene tetrahydromethanopterin reductase-like flavin-dependent oxidoreductase (luciferase family)
MIFDLFHSLSDPKINQMSLGPDKVFSAFIDQAKLAEELGADTVWAAESHFSSETQKKTSFGTIPYFEGEVGINCDSFQMGHWLLSRTNKINYGVAIHNIVGGSGGPIASADRVNSLHFYNSMAFGGKRNIRIGVAAGRFPYQNNPFQIIPRNHLEKEMWNEIKPYIFFEALEIFLRLLRGEELGSENVTQWKVEHKNYEIEKRWLFEPLKLVPVVANKSNLEIILGSHDPKALEHGLRFWDLSLFNLSFTSPEQIESLQQKMGKHAAQSGRLWNRGRLPRTVMVFIDKQRNRAYDLASQVLDNYIEAMRGTAMVPDKEVLLSRALVGDPSEIREQIGPGGSRSFHPEDRLMLWFEFNQLDNQEILRQMKLFWEEVAPKIV